jgi:hypothetical protein
LANAVSSEPSPSRLADPEPLTSSISSNPDQVKNYRSTVFEIEAGMHGCILPLGDASRFPFCVSRGHCSAHLTAHECTRILISVTSRSRYLHKVR